MTMNASDNDDGNIRCSRSRFALIITLLVRDRGQVEEKRSDKSGMMDRKSYSILKCLQTIRKICSQVVLLLVYKQFGKHAAK